MRAEKLTETEALRESCSEVLEEAKRKGHFQHWAGRLTALLEWFQATDEDELASEEAQRRLWDAEDVAATGQGNINMDAFFTDQALREWLAHELSLPVPDSTPERRARIVDLAGQIEQRIFPHLRRKARLKMYRVLATVFPRDFTTVADGSTLRKLHKAMGLSRETEDIPRHFAIVDRLESVLGPCEAKAAAVAERMMLPWLLYEYVVAREDLGVAEDNASESGEGQLSPLPAARRRRGLTAIRGSFETLLGILDAVGDGATRDELLDHLRSVLSGNQESSLGVVINAMIGEFGVLYREGDEYRLTSRGVAVLETGDSSELGGWLITRILGVDTAMAALRDEGAMANADLVERIKEVNPGWTSTYAPAAMTSWLRALGYIESAGDRLVALSERGEELARRITWSPESLGRDPEPVIVEPQKDDEEKLAASVQRATPEAVSQRIKEDGAQFDERLIRDLHAGIWADGRRHLAVLTGLSGTGKTLLAKAYGEAVVEGDFVHSPVEVIPVQPGWYDPGALMGYVNPLSSNTYVRTPFLDFLLKAAQYPEIPHTVVLDEMNLSHPEQYLAPILSAMEKAGGKIPLHQEGPDFDGVPDAIDYPANLVIIGTVNMDETTHGLSDKLLDRAFTLEFWDARVEAFPRWEELKLSDSGVARVRALLSSLYGALRPARMHFGWRTIDYIIGFLNVSVETEEEGELQRQLDSVVYAKILPKLRGDDSPRFRKAVDEMLSVLNDHGLTESDRRLTELKDDLDATGAARFWR